MAFSDDPVVRDLWHPIAALAELEDGQVRHAVLTGTPIACGIGPGGPFAVRRGEGERALPCHAAFGYLWTSLGAPSPLFAIPEWNEPDRRRFNAGTFGVKISAPRAIENFLDMGHFPFVHTGILGAEPHTEVKDYDVEVKGGEIVATRCRFFQPLAAAASTEGAEVEYIYRVPHPFASVLYKSNPVDPSRMDVIALFILPVGPEEIRAHLALCLIDPESEEVWIRRFQQTIFSQDKPILENQYPRRLPLDPKAETPIRADKMAIAYRRWLSSLGLTYGVIPALQPARAWATNGVAT
jgi:phenylpropionate dioxygenase-like ring-hydroxylating dioxygenase large terminal subunit